MLSNSCKYYANDSADALGWSFMDIGRRSIGFLGRYLMTTSKELNLVDLLIELLYENSATGTVLKIGLIGRFIDRLILFGGSRFILH